VQHVEDGQEGRKIPTADGGYREVPTGGSLGARMAQRAEQLEQISTEWFPIPGWESLLEVELRALGYATIRKVISRLDKVRDVGTHDMYAMADQIAVATVGFREVLEDGKTRPIDDDWVRLAQRLPEAPKDLTTRRAILFLVGDTRIHFLVQDWGEWAKSIRLDTDQEVARDFAKTE
jgi:hypothetical protein